MVEQLGFAIILSSFVSASALISGTTNFFAGSILQAEELSITVIPASANFGAHSREVLPPAEKIATLGFAAIASVMLTTLYFFPLYSTSFPTDLSEATGINSVNGKFLSASTCNILVPTNPVAPTTATFILLFLFPSPFGEGQGVRLNKKAFRFGRPVKLLYDHIHTLQTFRLRRTVLLCVLYASYLSC